MKNIEMIELRQLRYFIAVADELDFDRAAKRLGTDRSFLAQGVRDAERVLGVRLFDSNAGSTRLTRAGASFLEYGKQVIALMEKASESARSVALGHTNQLRLGLSDCIAYSRITDVLAQYGELNTDSAVAIYEMPLHQQVSHMRDGLLDASISLDGSPRDGISRAAIASDEIHALMPAAHPLVKSDIISTSDLALYPLILFSGETDLGCGTLVEDFVAAIKRARIAHRARSLGTMLTLISLGHGVGLLGAAQVASINRRGFVLRPIRGTAPLTTYMLHSGGGLSERLVQFVELAREQLFGSSTSEIS